MTSRRAIKHWDQKVSRALQFIPGHVGGRVASAQPVVRRDGTIRAMGTLGGPASTPTLPPAVVFTATLEDEGYYPGSSYDSFDVVFDIISAADGYTESGDTYIYHPVESSYPNVLVLYGTSPWSFEWYKADLLITDPTWVMQQGIGGGTPAFVTDYWAGGTPRRYPLASLTLTVNGVAHVGVLGTTPTYHGDSPDWDAWCFRFPTLAVPFTLQYGSGPAGVVTGDAYDSSTALWDDPSTTYDGG